MSRLLDATWKRVVAALLVSAGIILAVQTFAASTYLQSQKLQLESTKGDHCRKWQVTRQDGTDTVRCVRWERS